MKKTFDAVTFQRERRKTLSAKLAKMSPEQIVKYFQSMEMTPRRRVRSRATAHNTRNNGVRFKSHG